MQEWEYLVCPFAFGIGSPNIPSGQEEIIRDKINFGANAAESTLNYRAKQGWELVTVANSLAIFRRRATGELA